ncbi:copper-binding protein [Paraburkholderia phenoliruptrix]|uniref:copper-binding protein n=1 Tax=Paraburkholderia phenoliruptrix TaxID=252970 RepID=UPI0034CD317E
MKNATASAVMVCALAVCTSAHAGGHTHEMSEAGDTSDASSMNIADSANHRMSHGEVRKVDVAAGKLTIRHGPLENLGMDAMTMTFKVKDRAMLSQVKAGDKIDFVAEEVGGALTVVELHKQ